MITNPQNPNAPPIYPCGACHREVHENLPVSPAPFENFADVLGCSLWRPGFCRPSFARAAANFGTIATARTSPTWPTTCWARKSSPSGAAISARTCWAVDCSWSRSSRKHPLDDAVVFRRLTKIESIFPRISPIILRLTQGSSPEHPFLLTFFKSFISPVFIYLFQMYQRTIVLTIFSIFHFQFFIFNFSFSIFHFQFFIFNFSFSIFSIFRSAQAILLAAFFLLSVFFFALCIFFAPAVFFLLSFFCLKIASCFKWRTFVNFLC